MQNTNNTIAQVIAKKEAVQKIAIFSGLLTCLILAVII